MFKSIRSKVALYVAVLIVVIVIFQAIGNMILAKPYLKYTKTNEMMHMFEELKGYILNHDDFEQAMYHYREVENIQVTIHNEQSLVFTSESAIDTLDVTAYHEQPEIEMKINEHTLNESLYLNGLIQLDETIYYVSLYTPLSAIDHSVLLVNQMNFMIAVVAVIIGSGLAFLWGRQLTQPIIEINEVAQNVAILNFDKRLEVGNKQDEISVLRGSINSMSDQLFAMIQALQNANEQLCQDMDHQKRIDEMRKSFIANVSHELKSPLALLVMYCENLKNGIANIDEQFYYDVIVDESKRLSGLVHKLLEISSLENGLVKMSFDLMDLSNMVVWLCSKKSVLYNKNNTKLYWDVEDDLFIQGDVFYLEQAISNLLDNASRFAEDKKIHLSLCCHENFVTLRVENKGPIVPENDRDKIWDAFYRQDKAHTANEEGHTGLGLYITKTIVVAHQGRYGADELKEGMSFYMTFDKGEKF